LAHLFKQLAIWKFLEIKPLGCVFEIPPPLFTASRLICLNGFKPSALSISPKKFGSPKCRQDASVIKRAAKLLMSSPEKTIIEIISKLSKEK